MNKGIVDIVSKGGLTICEITDGGFFGDVGFFCGREFSFENSLERMEEGHTFFARTSSFCDLFWISSADFAYILDDLYAQYGVIFARIAHARWKFCSSNIPYLDSSLLQDHVSGLHKNAYPSRYNSLRIMPISAKGLVKSALQFVKNVFSYGAQSPQLSTNRRTLSSRMEGSLRMQDTELITDDGFSEAIEALGKDSEVANNKRSEIIKHLGGTVQVQSNELETNTETATIPAEFRAAIRRMSGSGSDLAEFYEAQKEKEEEGWVNEILAHINLYSNVYSSLYFIIKKINRKNNMARGRWKVLSKKVSSGRLVESGNTHSLKRNSLVSPNEKVTFVSINAPN